MSVLDDIQTRNSLDIDDMYHKIIHMPEHILMAYENCTLHNNNNIAINSHNQINRVLIAGMGGSAIAGDLASRVFSEFCTIIVCKDYFIPKINSQTLFIAISYSGNTEETLSATKSALLQTKLIAAVTTGNQLEDLLAEEYPIIKPPTGYPPRSAIAYLFASLVRLLELYGVIPSQEKYLKATTANLMRKAGSIAYSIPNQKNLAKFSATSIYGKIPVIYAADPDLLPVSYRWKCQINENAKYPAFNNTFSEMNHNEIEAWESQTLSKVLIPIFLTSFSENELYQRRLHFFKSILERNHQDYLEFFSEGESSIEKSFSLVYLGDMVSYYLALLNNVNPTSIDYILELKEWLG